MCKGFVVGKVYLVFRVGLVLFKFLEIEVFVFF